jgi:hypothetical protein
MSGHDLRTRLTGALCVLLAGAITAFYYSAWVTLVAFIGVAIIVATAIPTEH